MKVTLFSMISFCLLAWSTHAQATVKDRFEKTVQTPNSRLHVNNRLSCGITSTDGDNWMFIRMHDETAGSSSSGLYFSKYQFIDSQEILGRYDRSMGSILGIMWNVGHDIYPILMPALQYNSVSSELELIQKDESESPEFRYFKMKYVNGKAVSADRLDYPRLTFKRVDDTALTGKIEFSPQTSVYLMCEHPDNLRDGRSQILPSECGLNGTEADRVQSCKTHVASPRDPKKRMLSLVSSLYGHNLLWKDLTQNILLAPGGFAIPADVSEKSFDQNCQDLAIKTYGTDFGRNWGVAYEEELRNYFAVNGGASDPEVLVRSKDPSDTMGVKFPGRKPIHMLGAAGLVRPYYCVGR